MKIFTEDKRAVSKVWGRSALAATNDLLKPLLYIRRTVVLFLHASFVTLHSKTKRI